MNALKKVTDLKMKLEAIQARLRRAEAQQAQIERRHATRQKVLAGICLLKEVDEGRLSSDEFFKILKRNLSERDFKAFRP